MSLFDLCDDMQGPKVAFSDNKIVSRKRIYISRSDTEAIFVTTTVFIDIALADHYTAGEAESQFGASFLFCKRGRW